MVYRISDEQRRIKALGGSLAMARKHPAQAHRLDGLVHEIMVAKVAQYVHETEDLYERPLTIEEWREVFELVQARNAETPPER